MRDYCSGFYTSPAIEWIPALGCWCAFETDAITAIFKSDDFIAADFAEWHRSLDRMGIDCSAVIEILDHVATANEGKRHAEIRKNMARIIAAKGKLAKEAADRKLSELAPSLLRDGRRVDLVLEIVRPVCDTLFETLLGVPLQPDDGISASQIFDLYLSLNRRKEVVAKAGAMLEAFTMAQDRLDTAPGYATALKILGYDSIVGSLGGSILHVLEQAPGKRLSDISYSDTMPRTGVPYVERFASIDCRLGDADIKKADRIRLYLDPGTQRDHNNNGECNFGRGRHSCLGEDLSTWLWRTLTDAFGRLPLRFTIESETRRKPDWVFTYYSSIVVRFHA